MTDSNTTYSDQQLLDFILAMEDALLEEGMSPEARGFELPHRVLDQLGYVSYFTTGPDQPAVLERLRAIHERLYRPHDVGMGRLHSGAFMFRGIAVHVFVPIVFGQVRVRPFEWCDLNEMQVQWLQSNAFHVKAYLATFADIFDFCAGIHPFEGYAPPNDAAKRWFDLASFQLQGASAILCAHLDGRGATQSALLGSELALKAPLAANGVAETELKKLGHDLKGLADEVAARYSDFDLPAVQQRVALLPPYVANRYAPVQPSLFEAGEIVVAAQFVAAEAMRAVTGGRVQAKAGAFAS